jgi:hypothetical protein
MSHPRQAQVLAALDQAQAHTRAGRHSQARRVLERAAQLAATREVRALRRQGANWRDVGEALGISHQTAMRRYGEDLVDGQAHALPAGYVAAVMTAADRGPRPAAPDDVALWERSRQGLPSALFRLCPCGDRQPDRLVDPRPWQDIHSAHGWAPDLAFRVAAAVAA